MNIRIITIAVAGLVLTLLGGCANFGNVQAFEKGYLAKESMTFGGDRLETGFHEHIYTSKENASGGSGVGGGGCGCN
jgi:Domain of unknown function (DUF4266)